MFGATSIVKNSDKENYAYRGYGIAFDGDKDISRNVVIFGVGCQLSNTIWSWKHI